MHGRTYHPVAGVLDEPFSQLTPLSPPAYIGWNRAHLLCSLAGRYGYSAERAKLSRDRLKLPLLEVVNIHII